MLNRHIKTISQISLSSTAMIAVSLAISGCSQEQEAQNMFIIMQEKQDGSYEVIEKHPTTGPSRAIIKDIHGNERMLTNEEMQKLAQQEAQKINNGQEIHSNGMSMGEAILAAATGAILGNLIGSAMANRLSNNPRFQQTQRQSANKTSAYTRSAKQKQKQTAKRRSKSGFFGRSSGRSSSRGFFGG